MQFLLGVIELLFKLIVLLVELIHFPLIASLVILHSCQRPLIQCFNLQQLFVPHWEVLHECMSFVVLRLSFKGVFHLFEERVGEHDLEEVMVNVFFVFGG